MKLLRTAIKYILVCGVREYFSTTPLVEIPLHGRFDIEDENIVRPGYRSTSGWLDTRGRFYECAYNYHALLADALGYSERQLENMGWVKLSGGEIPTDYDDHRDIGVNQAQLNALFDWYQRHNKRMPKWLAVR